MSETTTIEMKEWNPSSGMTEKTGEELSIYAVARSMTLENFVKLFDEFLNLGGKGYREGQLVGKELRTTHRSLQRLAICFAFGIIVGLSEQQFTDPRNETAIESARKVKHLIEQGELPFGAYI